MQLTDHFTLDEFELSQTAARAGLDNHIPIEFMANVRQLAATLERIRNLLGRPITITSGYRSPAVNKRVGGAAKSAHLEARAADFICPAFGSPRKVAQYLQACPIEFDQLIEEGTWLHLAIPPTGQPARREILTARFDPEGRATYTKGLT